MRTRAFWPAALLMALAVPVPLHAGTSVGVSFQIGDPPPPVVTYRAQPNLIHVSGTMVYVVDDETCPYDFFHVGSFWYIHDRGHWYRARSYRGPFVVFAERSVPPAIMRVPARHWRHPHGGPPGQMKKQQAMVVKEKGGRGRR